MKCTPAPQHDIPAVLAVVRAFSTPQHDRIWIAPGGATTVSREKAQRWARWMNSRMVDGMISAGEPRKIHLSSQGYENFLAACNAGAKPNTALLRAARLHKDRKASGEIK